MIVIVTGIVRQQHVIICIAEFMSSLYEFPRVITTNFEQYRINASFATYLSRGLFFPV